MYTLLTGHYNLPINRTIKHPRNPSRQSGIPILEANDRRKPRLLRRISGRHLPDMGWHIKGEMGGLWAHPIKLLDGFHAAVVWGTDTIALDTAHSYATTPIGSIFTFNFDGHSARKGTR